MCHHAITGYSPIFKSAFKERAVRVFIDPLTSKFTVYKFACIPSFFLGKVITFAMVNAIFKLTLIAIIIGQGVLPLAMKQIALKLASIGITVEFIGAVAIGYTAFEFAFVAIAAGAAQAATLTVQADGLGDYPTIQAGVDAALPGDTVLLAPGVYMGGGNVNVSYLGKGITVTSEDSDPATCIIDCQAVVLSPARGFTFDSGEDESAVLSCVTVREGMQLGGAVYCEGSSPTIERCIFLNNTATDVASYYLGGALMCYMAAPLIRDCEFIGNEAIWGGAIGGLSSTVHVLDCGFEGNTGGLGGAFYLDHDQGSKSDRQAPRAKRKL